MLASIQVLFLFLITIEVKLLMLLLATISHMAHLYIRFYYVYLFSITGTIHNNRCVVIMSTFSKPILPELYQSDPRLLGSGCKKYSVQRSSSSESQVLQTPADNSKESFQPPSTFQELDAEISAFKCSSHYKTCSQGRGGCFGRNFFSESEVRATEMLQLL